MRILLGTMCLLAAASFARAEVPVDVACTIESYGSFPAGDEWTGIAESDDADPGTLTGTGEWTHVLPDGRQFRGKVELVRCRANGGVLGNLQGHGRIHGAKIETDRPGLAIGQCIGKGQQLIDLDCLLLGPPGRTTYQFDVNARDDGENDTLSFQLRNAEGEVVYINAGTVTDNGDVVITPRP